VYVTSDPKPPKIAFETQLAGAPAWQITPARPDLSVAAPLTKPWPIIVIPATTGRGVVAEKERVELIKRRTATAVPNTRIIEYCSFQIFVARK
jgi:hypothetical protein